MLFLSPVEQRGRSAATTLIACVFVALSLSACGQSAKQRVIPAELSDVSEREAHRKLNFDGADNFRDLGGYQTADGRTVKWGLVYRSDALSDLSHQDREFMKRLGISTVVDFRTPYEKQEDPDQLPPTVNYVERPVDVEGTAVKQLMETITSGELEGFDARKVLIDANRGFVRSFTPVFGAHLKSLIEPDTLPVVAHCTGGKDRAGFAAALTLLALGVPEQTVIKDFLKTNTYTEDKIEKYVWMIRLGSFFKTDPDVIRPLLGVEEVYIQTAIDTIKQDYGSVETYLKQGVGMSEADLSKLRSRLLNPAST